MVAPATAGTPDANRNSTLLLVVGVMPGVGTLVVPVASSRSIVGVLVEALR
ncbi:hypothetical protein [Nonomuraea sp. NPDC050643]|uniref:hypothetical protein n=1 Tax=Nonomuraea sp. NPDC050643 TaxID=3155660 RepID=UPI00340FB994